MQFVVVGRAGILPPHYPFLLFMRGRYHPAPMPLPRRFLRGWLPPFPHTARPQRTPAPPQHTAAPFAALGGLPIFNSGVLAFRRTPAVTRLLGMWGALVLQVQCTAHGLAPALQLTNPNPNPNPNRNLSVLTLPNHHREPRA